jgi:hypothetical protein
VNVKRITPGQFTGVAPPEQARSIVLAVSLLFFVILRCVGKK